MSTSDDDDEDLSFASLQTALEIRRKDEASIQIASKVKFQESLSEIESPRKKAFVVQQVGNKSLNVTPKKMPITRPLHDHALEELSKTVQPINLVQPFQPASHPPFQPGSTSQDVRGDFILVCNHIGTVTSIKSSDPRSNSKQRTCHIMFYSKIRSSGGCATISGLEEFELGALSYEGVALASKTSLLYRPHKPSSEPWTWILPDGELALAVAVGSDWVAVATR